MRRRRRNPMPSTGALLINPRRRKKAAPKRRRKAATKRRKNSSASSSRKRSLAAKKAAATRRRNARKRSLAAKKAVVTRRRNATKRVRRSNPKRRVMARRPARRPVRRRSTRKGMPRRTARRAYMRRNRRRNPALGKVTAPVQRMLKKVPIVGKMLSEVVGFSGPALLGAVSVYPTLQAMRYAGSYIPERLQPVSFSIVGAVLATVVGKLPFGTPSFRKSLSAAMAAAGGAVDFYRWHTNQSTVVEVQAAETAGLGYAGGMATGVVPYSGGYGALEVMAGPSGYGALEIAGDYAGAALGDAYWSGGDFSGDEISCAMAGPRHWRRRFGRPARTIYRRGGGLRNRAQSGMAGKHGHRWGWLVKLVGFEGMRQIASLPPQQRQRVIASLKQRALASLPALLSDHATSDSQVSSDEAAQMGALVTMAGW